MPFRPIYLCILCALTSCSTMKVVTEDVARIDLPTNWTQSSDTASSIALLPEAWWTVFEDEDLNALMGQVLDSNHDLSASAYTVQRYALEAGLAGADRLPKLSAGLQARASQDLTGGKTTKSYGAVGAVSFQLDVFGKLAKMQDIKKWAANASVEDHRQLILAITTEAASLYWQLNSLNQELRLSKDSVAYAEALLKIAQVRFRAGSIALMDVETVKQQLFSIKNKDARLQDQYHQVQHQLALIQGKSPQINPMVLTKLSEKPLPLLPRHVPAVVLSNRPDIQAALWRLMASRGGVDAAVRDFFPDITLSANVDGKSSQLSDVLQNPLGSIGAHLLLPFLNWPSNQLRLKVSKVQYQEDLIRYQKTLYEALKEVEDAFSEETMLDQQRSDLAAYLLASERLLGMQEVRFKAGADGLKELLDAEEKARDARLSVLANHLARHQNFLKRFLVLGGK